MATTNTGSQDSTSGFASYINGGSSMPTSPWSYVGQAADLAGSFMPQKTEYQGEKGAITAGMDAAYDTISDTAMSIPPVGTIVGGAMKAGKLLGQGLNAIGLGTDGMTTQDAILGSSFFSWNVGLINGIGAKKSATMERNNQTWANTGNSYTGTANDFDSAMNKQGKKYGLFSRNKLGQANDAIYEAGRNQNILSDIVDQRQLAMESLSNQTDMLNTNYKNNILGGYNQNQIRAAKNGGLMFTRQQLNRAHKISFNFKLNNEDYSSVEFKDDWNDEIEKFQKGGQMTLIPEGALHAHKHHIEDTREDLDGNITHKGIPVVNIVEDGGEIQQSAEIERNEVILSLDLTNLVEENRKKFKDEESPSKKDELAFIAGDAIVNEFLNNLDDKTGLFKSIKV